MPASTSRGKPTPAVRLARDYQKRIAPVMHMLNVELQSVTKQRVVATMKIQDFHMNHTGRVNGGVLMAFADVMGAMGTRANLPPGHRTTTLESKTNFFAAGQPPMLKAVSVPHHLGRTTMVWETTIRNATDHRVVAVVTQTQIVIPVADKWSADPPKPHGKPAAKRAARKPAGK